MTGSWSVCPVCGCVVADTTEHTAWHEVLAARAAATADAATGAAWSGDPVPVVPPLSDAERAEQATDRAALDALGVAAATARTDGQPWVKPSGAHNAYRLGITVTHAGRTWRSLTPFNVWEPPTAWREEVAAGYPAWVRPTGAHNAYKTGDRVTFEGAVYESLIDANVYSPIEYPAGWKKL